MPPSSEKAKKGKDFEGSLVSKIKTQAKKYGVQFIRLYDSYSGFTKGQMVKVRIPGQWSDFIFIFKESRCCFVEFKYTESGNFHLGMLSDSQRLGFESSLVNDVLYFILVFCDIEKKYYMLNSKRILELNPKKIASRRFDLKETFLGESFESHKDIFKYLNNNYNLMGNKQ